MNDDKFNLVLKVVVIALALSICLPFITSENQEDHSYDYR